MQKKRYYYINFLGECMKLSHMFNVIVCLLCLIITQQSYAIIVRGEVLRKQRPDGTYNYVYALYDVGYESTLINPSLLKENSPNFSQLTYDQSHNLLNYLTMMPQDKTTFLVEDGYHYQDNTPVLSGTMQQFDTLINQFYFNMAAECGKKKEIRRVNIEFRQKPISALKYLAFCDLESLLTLEKNNRFTQPCFSKHIYHLVQALKEDNSIKEKLTNQQNEYDLPIKNFLESFLDTLVTITTYNDGEVLNSYYHTELEQIIKQGEHTFSTMANNVDLQFSKFITTLGHEKGSIFAGNYVNYAANFISIKALHEIHQSFTTTDNTFLLTNLSQANNIVEKLKQLEGYESINYKGVSQDIIQKFLQNTSIFSHLDECMQKPLLNYEYLGNNEDLVNSLVEALHGASLDNINFLKDYLPLEQY